MYPIDTPLDTFRSWGFIDDTALRTCRVVIGQDVADNLALSKKGSGYIQQAFYR